MEDTIRKMIKEVEERYDIGEATEDNAYWEGKTQAFQEVLEIILRGKK